MVAVDPALAVGVIAAVGAARQRAAGVRLVPPSQRWAEVPALSLVPQAVRDKVRTRSSPAVRYLRAMMIPPLFRCLPRLKNAGACKRSRAYSMRRRGKTFSDRKSQISKEVFASFFSECV